MRAEYVIEEIQRVLDVCEALEKDDYETVGKKMYETHHGMSKLYEVSSFCFFNEVVIQLILNKDDYETVGKKMYETHHGMSKLYEVSCEELDFLNASQTSSTRWISSITYSARI